MNGAARGNPVRRAAFFWKIMQYVEKVPNRFGAERTHFGLTFQPKNSIVIKVYRTLKGDTEIV